VQFFTSQAENLVQGTPLLFPTTFDEIFSAEIVHKKEPNDVTVFSRSSRKGR
jgi:hypothetical protein